LTGNVSLNTPARRTSLFQASIASQSALFAPPRLEARHAIAWQSAALGRWLNFNTVYVEDDGQPPAANLDVPNDTGSVPIPAHTATAVDGIAPSVFPVLMPQLDFPPFEPDRRAYRVREGSFIPANANGFVTYGDVFVRNGTSYDIDVELLLNAPLNLNLQRNQPQVLLIHTHTTEAFFPNEQNWYVPTDVERTDDANFNVVRIGDELARVLTAHGFNVLHDRTIYDFPTFAGAYSRALESIESYIERYPSIAIVIDIHRDSIMRDDGTIYSAVTKYNGENHAQMMFVMGSSGSGQPFPHWRENLAFAAQLQQAVLARVPNSMRPILMRNGRFNQHATTGSLLLEVGSSGNCLSEAIRAVRIFGEEMAGVLSPLLPQ